MLIRPYGVVLTLALFTLVLWTDRQLRSYGGSLLDRPGVILGMLAGAAVGGRLHFFLESLFSGARSGDLLHLASPLSGGTTFFGAAIGAAAALILMRRRLSPVGLPLVADAFVWGTAGAIFIGRLGCVLQGCCLGIPTTKPWGIPSPLWGSSAAQELVRREPFPIYLGVWALGAAAIAWSWKQGELRGQRALAFVALFAAGRIPLEFLRDRPLGSSFPSLQQWESLALCLAAFAALAMRELRGVRGAVGGLSPSLGADGKT